MHNLTIPQLADLTAIPEQTFRLAIAEGRLVAHEKDRLPTRGRPHQVTLSAFFDAMGAGHFNGGKNKPAIAQNAFEKYQTCEDEAVRVRWHNVILKMGYYVYAPIGGEEQVRKL